VEETPTAVDDSGRAPAHFTADRLVVRPLTERTWGPLPFVTRRGSDAVVAITVANTGEEGGLFTAALVLDGEVMGWRDVFIPAGEQKQIRFRVANVTMGTHWVSLAGFTATFTASQRVNWGLVAVAGFAALGLACIAAERLRRTHG